MGPGTEAKEFSSQQFANFIFGFLSSPRIGRPVFVVSRDQRDEKRNKLCEVQLPLSAIVFRAKVEIDLWFLLWFNLDRFFNHHFGMGWHAGEWVSEVRRLGLWKMILACEDANGAETFLPDLVPRRPSPTSHATREESWGKMFDWLPGYRSLHEAEGEKFAFQ